MRAETSRKDTNYYKYFMVYKPYGMVCRFTAESPGQSTLAELKPRLPEDVYPIGRLDKDSEGLLLLTNDPALNNRLLHPKFRHRRTYRVQVERLPTPEALLQLAQGVVIATEKGPYRTLPAEVRLLADPPAVPERDPPVRFRAAIPTAWLELTLTEGKNRQVRRMCAAVGFPVLRLIRIQIQELHAGHLTPGHIIELEQHVLFRQLLIL